MASCTDLEIGSREVAQESEKDELREDMEKVLEGVLVGQN